MQTLDTEFQVYRLAHSGIDVEKQAHPIIQDEGVVENVPVPYPDAAAAGGQRHPPPRLLQLDAFSDACRNVLNGAPQQRRLATGRLYLSHHASPDKTTIHPVEGQFQIASLAIGNGLLDSSGYHRPGLRAIEVHRFFQCRLIIRWDAQDATRLAQPR